ncbi:MULTISPECIES: TetR/AcrR family transcriptional regulator [Bacillus cereus group]|uniref:TetR family transcriptional regulator n=1 Tax=Bacillus thuringiensis subsp. medellin TaxID=79672 RepID=A0A9X6NAE7_BACTV|nr:MULTISPECIES: TetR/AcrR family transcriptional regulator [Bacillus cereus group]MDM5375199.1 TetR/AcrR family transcriptional regulator [Bacillus bombysepticus]MCR6787939.1 TetR/AcrR family transcriptional regulator [Bacillus thuringiensis]MCR6822375.1 TetR/AcrR family transcriptional regulator [Bacillus thuringiensis]MCR6830015.1 TetR/AcrR family transcriptional regulator [Bacillus thuringiensis]MDZ3952141.1 TetR/AcrR family transcriptional regulator [Bacillus thuringiensis]
MRGNENVSTKEKILNTTLELIKKEGFERVKIRKIAALSDVNIALVNYHFGSKEKLISETIRVLLISFQGTFSILDNITVPAKERLKIFLLDYVLVIRQYPELVRKIIAMGTTVFTSQYEYGDFLKRLGFSKVKNILSEITNETDQEILMMMTVQIFGSIFLPTLMMPILESGADIKVPSVEKQIDFLFERYFYKN